MWSSLFSNPAYDAAMNALLAEHSLGLVELVPSNPVAKELRDSILSIFRSGTKIGYDENWWITTFNHEDRIVQLNFVAMALNDMGFTPMVPRAKWRPVANPLVITRIADKIPKAEDSIFSEYRERISINPGKLIIHDWGVSDSNHPVDL